MATADCTALVELLPAVSLFGVSTETFFPVNDPLFRDYYSVSQYGNVMRICTNRLLRPRLQHGYRYVELGNGLTSKNIRVCRLVAFTFLGAPPDLSYQVAHIDGDRANDQYDNLRWATKSENERDKLRHGTSSVKKHNIDLGLLVQLRQEGAYFKEIAEYVGCSEVYVRKLFRVHALPT